MRARITKLFSPYMVDFEHRVNLKLCLETLKSIGVTSRAQLIKTWLNGWVTSHRMTEPVLLDCLLGCPGASDTLSHYLICPRVFAAAKFVVQDTSDDPLIRCGLCDPSKGTHLIAACTFTAYHALKASIRNLNAGQHAAGQPMEASNNCFFAQHFSAEAVESRLSTALFNPDAFFSFLIRASDEDT